jgi:uncharacterized protein (DUF302 family)
MFCKDVIMKTTTAVLMGLSLLTAACSPAASPQISSVESNAAMTATAQPAIITVTSPHSFEQTTARVAAAIEKRPLNLFAKIDHAAGAAKAELSLAPSTLFIFGNPKGGTPLMTRNPQMGIVLPLKMHVYQDEDDVKISYTDIAAEAKVYGLDNEQLPIPNIVKMLSGLAAEVTAP